MFMNHTASGLPRPDRTERRVAGTKHTTNRNTLLLKSFCVTRKKGENRVGEHESIDYINFVTNNTKCRETGLVVYRASTGDLDHWEEGVSGPAKRPRATLRLALSC